MHKPLSLALLVIGVILVGYGLDASHSPDSGISRFFSGSPTDRTLWLLMGGLIAAAVGAAGLLRGTKSQ